MCKYSTDVHMHLYRAESLDYRTLMHIFAYAQTPTYLQAPMDVEKMEAVVVEEQWIDDCLKSCKLLPTDKYIPHQTH